MSRIVLALILAVIVARAAELKPVPFTRYDHAIEAATKTGKSLLATRELMVDAAYPSGKLGRGDLFVIFDKVSGFFYWQLSNRPANDSTLRITEQFSNQGRAYVADDRIVVFLGGGLMQWAVGIRESSRRAASLEDAEDSALREAKEHMAEIEAGSLWKYFKTQQVMLPLPNDFFVPKYSPMVGTSKLIEVSRQGANWELILEGVWNRPGQWKAKVILDDKYQPISWERVR
jgi:hypothetical protein